MYRNKMSDLVKWKNKRSKLPILLLGARQVGKTYLLVEFAKEYYEDYIYINFERSEEFKDLFSGNLNSERIISEIEYIFTKKIDPSKTLIIFDEVQNEMRVLTALKYFNENLPEYDIVCAGSLLGVAINKNSHSFPVGKVEFHYLYPFTFDEFLISVGKEMLLERIDQSFNNLSKISLPIHEMLLELYKKFLYVGGMPEAINSFIENDMSILHFDRKVHTNIINAYIADMSKYTSNSESIKVQAIYRSLPEQLAGDNRKFKYSVVKKNSRAINYGASIEWLLMSRITINCSKISNAEIPLSAYNDNKSFKLFSNDTGLLMTMCKVPFNIIRNEREDNRFKGAITENYVAAQLKCNEHDLYYWHKSNFEVDFIAMIDDEIIPIEVKSSSRNRSRSLNEYIRIYNPKFSIRLSAKNFGYYNNIKALPLYAAYLIK